MHTQTKARLVHRIRVVAVLLTASLIFQTLFISGQGEVGAKSGNNNNPGSKSANLIDKLRAFKKEQLKSNPGTIAQNPTNTQERKSLSSLCLIRNNDPLGLDPTIKTNCNKSPTTYKFIPSTSSDTQPNTTGTTGSAREVLYFLASSTTTTPKNPSVQAHEKCLKDNGVTKGQNPRIELKCTLNPNGMYKVTNSSGGSDGSSNTGTGGTPTPTTPPPAPTQQTNSTKPTSTTTSSNWLNRNWPWLFGAVGGFGIVFAFSSGNKNSSAPSNNPTIVSAPPVTPVTPVTPAPPAPVPDPLKPIKDLLVKLDERKLDTLRASFLGPNMWQYSVNLTPATIASIRNADSQIIALYNNNLLANPPSPPPVIMQHDLNNDGRINQADPQLIQDINEKCLLNETSSPCILFYDRRFEFTP